MSSYKKYQFSIFILVFILLGMYLGNVNIATSQFEKHQSADREIMSLGWSPNGSLVALGEKNANIKVIDKKGNFLFDLNDQLGGIVSVDWSQNSTLVASASLDSTIKIWNINKKVVVKVLNVDPSNLTSISFNNDSSLLASAGDLGFNIWNPNNGSQLFFQSTNPISSLEFHPTDPILLYVQQTKAIVWNYTSKSIEFDSINHKENITAAKWSNSGNKIATSSLDKTIRIWDDLGTPISTLSHQSQVLDISWNNNGEQIASLTSDRTLTIWDVNNRTEILKLNFNTGFLSESNLGDLNVLSWNIQGDSIVIGGLFEFLFNFNEDPDRDGLTNAQEIEHMTDPFDRDSDDDGLDDGFEIENGFDPTDSNDNGTSYDKESSESTIDSKSKTDETKTSTSNLGNTILFNFGMYSFAIIGLYVISSKKKF